MPRVYSGSRLVRYWYVPVAALLGVALAAGIVLAADRLFGGDGGNRPLGPLATATATSAVTATAPATVVTTQTRPPGTPVTGTPGAAGTPTAPAGSATPLTAFGVGDPVTVYRTGDCLNVRGAPSTQAPAISCIPDGTKAVVKAGPENVDGFRWWLIRAEGVVEGWAVDEYLSRSH